MPERVQPRIFRHHDHITVFVSLVTGERNSSLDLARYQRPIDDIGVALNVSRPLGNTRCSSVTGLPVASVWPVLRPGQARRHSLSALITIGGTGIVLSPASDLGRPMSLNLSALWWTR